MTRKHFVAMAEALRFEHPGRRTDAGTLAPSYKTEEAQWARDVRAVADVFAADNGRFDRARFYQAAGLAGTL